MDKQMPMTYSGVGILQGWPRHNTVREGASPPMRGCLYQPYPGHGRQACAVLRSVDDGHGRGMVGEALNDEHQYRECFCERSGA